MRVVFKVPLPPEVSVLSFGALHSDHACPCCNLHQLLLAQIYNLLLFKLTATEILQIREDYSLHNFVVHHREHFEFGERAHSRYFSYPMFETFEDFLYKRCHLKIVGESLFLKSVKERQVQLKDSLPFNQEYALKVRINDLELAV